MAGGAAQQRPNHQVWSLFMKADLRRVACPLTGVHVWQGQLDQPDWRVAEWARMLSPEETDRAAKFRLDQQRRRFVTRRGMLRALLGAYTHVAPSRIRFDCGSNGKPTLADGRRAPCFNVSHSRGLALYVVARDRQVGIDVEYADPDFAFEAVASRFFSQSENDALRPLAPQDRRNAFFRGWTRKEAYLKACGEGISERLQTCEVSLAQGEPAELRRTGQNSGDERQWMIQDVPVPAGYVAAMALTRRRHERRL
jgi:4'-phosphopantetheinyl transferase